MLINHSCDVLNCMTNTFFMYVTVFGKQPPIGEGRFEELGKWVRKEFHVSGNSWDSSSVDISAAGLGWFAIGLKGEAQFAVWTYEGVDVLARKALISHRSRQFEVAGFTVSKIVSQADQALNKQHRNEKKRKLSDLKTEAPSETSTLSHADTILSLTN